MAKRKGFSPVYDAGDILGLYRAKLAEGDEARLRALASTMREHVRLEHAVSIPEQYRAISKEVRTPYLRDAWTRISASLVSKPPVVHVEPKDDQHEDYTVAAGVAERWAMACMERLNKEVGEDVLYELTAALVRDGEAVLKVVHRPDSWANFPRLEGDEDAAEVLKRQKELKQGADLPIAWRVVDRLQMLFGDGEYGDEWALEYGEYATPYLKQRYGLREYDGELRNPKLALAGRPKPEGDLIPPASGGRCVKLEFFDASEWHVVINGEEPPGWPKANPYAPHLPYFRARTHESESLLYSLLYLVPRMDEALTMKLNWSYLGAYPNPVEKSTGTQALMPGLDGPLGTEGEPAKPIIWKPGKYMQLPAGRELGFLAPPPIGRDIDDFIGIMRDLIEVAGIPSVMRGSMGSDASGYLANQMLAAASMHYKLASLTLQRTMEQAFSFILWLIQHVIQQTVYVQGWQEVEQGKPRTRAGRAWLALSPDRDGKNVASITKLGPLTVQFRPTLPTDEQARAMIARQLTEGDDPLISHRHALEKWLEEEDPDTIFKQIVTEKAIKSEAMQTLLMDEALREAGLAPAKPEAPIDPLAQAQQLGQQLPGLPGQMQAGLPTIPGLNMPAQPAAPQGVPMPGGQPAGAYPGLPAGQGPSIA